MKSTIISMLVVLVVLVALPVIFLGDNKIFDGFDMGLGKPGSSGGVKMSSRIENVTTDTPVQIYRWRDENGILHFSNSEPADVKADELKLEPNLSSMDPVAPRENTAATVTATPTSTSPEIGNPYTPTGMKQLVEQASGLKKVISQQQLDQQKTIEGFSQKKH